MTNSIFQNNKAITNSDNIFMSFANINISYTQFLDTTVENNT